MAFQNTDVFVVNRGGTNYKVDYQSLKNSVDYTLPKATAGSSSTGTLGGVKVDGTTVTVDADGVIKANLPGALTYKGPLAPTDAPPASPVVGDVYIFSAGGTLNNAGWGTVNGATVTTGSLMIRQAGSWDIIATGGGAAGVTSISATANSGVQVTGGNTATPVIAGIDASETVKGVVQLADAAAITAGTVGRVVDAKQLAAAAAVYASSAETITGTVTTKSVTPAGAKAAYMPLDISKLTALP